MASRELSLAASDGTRLGERYARFIPGARMVVEDAGPPPRSPIAWQGGRLSKLLVELAGSAR